MGVRGPQRARWRRRGDRHAPRRPTRPHRHPTRPPRPLHRSSPASDAGGLRVTDAPVRTVFLGSGGFGVESLRRLAASPLVELVGVVTAPPRPAGRGGRLTTTPIHDAALDARRRHRPRRRTRLRAPDGDRRRCSRSRPTSWSWPTTGGSCPAALLDLRHGALNLHPSLLPRHRGATPIPAAILAGDPETGVTLMRMDEGLDTGPIVAQRAVPRSTTTPRHRRWRPSSRRWLPTCSARTSAPGWPARSTPTPQPDRRRDPDPAAAARGRAPGSVATRDGAGAPGPGVPAVARDVRRDAARPADRSGRPTPSRRRRSTRPAGTFDADGLAVGDGERLVLDEVQPAGGRADAVGRLRPRPAVDRRR